MKKIGLFYAPEGGSVEKIAKKVVEKIGSQNVDLISVQNQQDATLLNNYDKIIMGISTVGRDSWDSHYSKIGWDLFMPKLDSINLSGKTLAIFGLGNSILYPDNFVDSLGILGKKVKEKGAIIVGMTSVKGYDFSDSAAIIDNQFYGVAIDEDNEGELTEERLNKWLEAIKAEMGF